LKNDPLAVLMVCKAGTVDAKIRLFIVLSKFKALFFVLKRVSDETIASIIKKAALI